MCREDSIFAEGCVTGIRSERTYDIELANGHRLVGFVTKRDSERKITFETGQKVKLRLTPFDLSKGQVVF